MTMQRRDYLRGTATLGAAGLAGCLDVGDSNSDVTLSEPDRPFESADVPYPAWGQQIPSVTLPAPLADRRVSLGSVETPSLVTFFYSHCKTVCPVLVSTLRDVQTHAVENGYGDQVAFFPVTFDPARDDADRLGEYAEQMHVDVDAGNWHFLRPRSPERARAVVDESFGVAFQRQSSDSSGYMFAHTALTLLVNGDGYVERAYQTKSPDDGRIVDDLRAVRNA